MKMCHHVYCNQNAHNKFLNLKNIHYSRGRIIKDMYKEHMDQAKEGRFKGGKWGWVGQGSIVE